MTSNDNESHPDIIIHVVEPSLRTEWVHWGTVCQVCPERPETSTVTAGNIQFIEWYQSIVTVKEAHACCPPRPSISKVKISVELKLQTFNNRE